MSVFFKPVKNYKQTFYISLIYHSIDLVLFEVHFTNVIIFLFFKLMFKSSANNIKVLIIIGSNLDKDAKNLPPTNYNQFVSSLLISKIFTEMFNLKQEDIMITCPIEKYFSVKYQFPHTTPVQTSFSSFKEKHFPCKEFQISFKKTPQLFLVPDDNALCVDIQNNEYSFQMEPALISKLIKIFPYSLNQFQTNSQTELIVFLIDYGDTSSCEHYKFDKYISEILKLPSKHIHLFVDSYKSGTLIQMIHFSQFLSQLLKKPDESYDFSNETTSHLFRIFHDMHEIEKKHLNQEKPTQQFIDNFNDLLKDPNLISNFNPLRNIDIASIRRNLPFFHYLDEFNPGYIDFQSIYLFSKKGEAFCSSVGDLPSYFIPLRTVYQQDRTYYPGDIFLSACFEALFINDIKNPINQNTIISSIRNSIKTSKQLFADLLKQSYQDDYNLIDSFFDCFSQNAWFYLNNFDFPNLNAIRTKNITDITHIRSVKSNEYCVPSTQSCSILNSPIISDDSSDSEQYWAKSIREFQQDYPKILSTILEQHELKPFRFCDCPADPENFYPETRKYYTKIKSKIKDKIHPEYLNYLSECTSPFLYYIDQFKTDEIKEQVTKIFIKAFFILDEQWKKEYFDKYKKGLP